MTEAVPIEIPNRALFKASEVCELLKLQPYVLRTWEAEFPDLGVAKAAGSPRVYRREHVEQVLRIRHLLLVDGLTLAGARRKLEAEAAPAEVEELVMVDTISPQIRERVTTVKHGLRSLLELLNTPPVGPANGEFHLESLGTERASAPAAPAKGPTKRKRK